MDGKYSPSARRFKLYDLLKGLRYPIPVSELANHFGVHYDTIRRDLDQLEEPPTTSRSPATPTTGGLGPPAQ